MTVFNQLLIDFAAFLLIILFGLLLIKYVKKRKSKFENAQDLRFKQCSIVNVIKISPDEKREKRSSYIHSPSSTYVQEELEDCKIHISLTHFA
jgi:hypothetical protein